jgi:hypothetical protein
LVAFFIKISDELLFRVLIPFYFTHPTCMRKTLLTVSLNLVDFSWIRGQSVCISKQMPIFMHWMLFLIKFSTCLFTTSCFWTLFLNDFSWMWLGLKTLQLFSSIRWFLQSKVFLIIITMLLPVSKVIMLWPYFVIKQNCLYYHDKVTRCT